MRLIFSPKTVEYRINSRNSKGQKPEDFQLHLRINKNLFFCEIITVIQRYAIKYLILQS